MKIREINIWTKDKNHPAIFQASKRKQLNIDIDDSTAATIAGRARKTPRIANRLLKRVRDFSQVKHENKLDPSIAGQALDMLEVDLLGLDNVDRMILLAIIEKFQGGPVGLSTIAAATDQEIGTIEEVCEPFLIQAGLLQRTPRGRLATQLAYEHLGLNNQFIK